MADQLRRSMIHVDASLEAGMRSLEESKAQIVLVVDEQGALVGTLTDGDVRRAILAGASLSSTLAALVNRDFFSVTDRAARADVLELMAARQISQIPVLDASGRVVGLHLLQQMMSAVERPNVAVVLAGGRGTRLGDLTTTTPKPMLPVAGRPILERIVLHLVGSGIRTIYLSVNYLAEVIERHFGDGHRYGCSIHYLREQQPLGTAGSLSLLPQGDPAPSTPLLVMNGDLVTQANVGRLIDFHENGDQIATMGIRTYLEQVPFGCVEVSGDELVAFIEKPTTRRLVNTGIYVIEPAVLSLLPDPLSEISMPELIERARSSGGRVRVLEIDDDWIDVGRRDQFDKARFGE